MHSSRTIAALETVRDNVILVREFTRGESGASFGTDRKTFYATIRCLEVISEATRRLPEDLKARYPSIPWNDIAGAGNIYRHEYDRIVAARLWLTVQTGLTEIEAAVRTELGA